MMNGFRIVFFGRQFISLLINAETCDNPYIVACNELSYFKWWEWAAPYFKHKAINCPFNPVFFSVCGLDVVLQYKHGRPVLAVLLPSRQESCLFFLRPMLMTVGDLIHDLQREDPGVTSVSVLTKGRTHTHTQICCTHTQMQTFSRIHKAF